MIFEGQPLDMVSSKLLLSELSLSTNSDPSSLSEFCGVEELCGSPMSSSISLVAISTSAPMVEVVIPVEVLGIGFSADEVLGIGFSADKVLGIDWC